MDFTNDDTIDPLLAEETEETPTEGEEGLEDEEEKTASSVWDINADGEIEEAA